MTPGAQELWLLTDVSNHLLCLPEEDKDVLDVSQAFGKTQMKTNIFQYLKAVESRLLCWVLSCINGKHETFLLSFEKLLTPKEEKKGQKISFLYKSFPISVGRWNFTQKQKTASQNRC